MTVTYMIYLFVVFTVAIVSMVYCYVCAKTDESFILKMIFNGILITIIVAFYLINGY